MLSVTSEAPASPRKSPRSPSKEEVFTQLSPRHQPLLTWLAHLPDRVVQDVVQEVLARLEQHLLEDMDNKLILTLINIEKMRINDFYFGLHSLLAIIFKLLSKHKHLFVKHAHFSVRMSNKNVSTLNFSTLFLILACQNQC